MCELDYTREAEMAGVFRRIHADDPDVVMPRVHQSLTTRRVLTCDLIGGEDYATFCATAIAGGQERGGADDLALHVPRALQHGVLYADPHPGNYRFLGGRQGRVPRLRLSQGDAAPTSSTA